MADGNARSEPGPFRRSDLCKSCCRQRRRTNRSRSFWITAFLSCTIYHRAGQDESAGSPLPRSHEQTVREASGITVIGFWTEIDPKEGEEKLIYIVAYPSKEEDLRTRVRKEFRDDPDWKKVHAESEKEWFTVEEERRRIDVHAPDRFLADQVESDECGRLCQNRGPSPAAHG